MNISGEYTQIYQGKHREHRAFHEPIPRDLRCFRLTEACSVNLGGVNHGTGNRPVSPASPRRRHGRATSSGLRLADDGGETVPAGGGREIDGGFAGLGSGR